MICLISPIIIICQMKVMAFIFNFLFLVRMNDFYALECANFITPLIQFRLVFNRYRHASQTTHELLVRYNNHLLKIIYTFPYLDQEQNHLHDRSDRLYNYYSKPPKVVAS